VIINSIVRIIDSIIMIVVRIIIIINIILIHFNIIILILYCNRLYFKILFKCISIQFYNS